MLYRGNNFLFVLDGGQSVGLLVGVSLIAVVIVVVSISVFIWWKCKRNGSSMERCSGTSERNPRFQPEDESPQPAPGQVEQIGNHHDHPKPSTVKVARDSNKSLLQNGNGRVEVSAECWVQCDQSTFIHFCYPLWY